MAKFVILLICLAAIEASLALRCWTCSSNKSWSCMDPFNATNYTVNAAQPNIFSIPTGMPVLLNCTKPRIQNSNVKQVCLKQILNLPGKVVIRNCTTVPLNQSVGACPNKTGNTEYCEYCDTDGCNEANVVKSNFLAAVVVPFLLFLCLRT